MVALPPEILIMYTTLVIWAGLLLNAYRRRSYTMFLRFGVAFALVLNARYFVSGIPNGIAFFVGVYDVLHNAGNTSQADSLIPCFEGDECSVWDEAVFSLHPSWGVAFYNRFVNAQRTRTLMLYSHIFFNTMAFVLIMVQLHQTGFDHRRKHQLIGYAALISLVFGVSSSLYLASEHVSVTHYGGSMSTWGFYFMASCVVFCAAMGLVSILRKDVEAHNRWMVRFAGSMWGSFWMFRIMEFVLGPLLRNHDTVSILMAVWLSAPLGIAVAEYIICKRAPDDRHLKKKVY